MSPRAWRMTRAGTRRSSWRSRSPGGAALLAGVDTGDRIATRLVTLGTDERAAGQVWHLPGPATVTTRAVLDLVADQVNYPVAVRNVPKLALHALGLVSPMMRGLAETTYQFEQPLVLDTAKYESTFDSATTPLATAIADTIAWYRTQASTP